MARIYRTDDVDPVMKEGYSATYVADLLFSKAVGSAGVILVDIEAGKQTKPHAHNHLEEIFIPLGQGIIGIDGKRIALKGGDVVVVERGETHWFQADDETPLRVIAIKTPNLKNDKVG